MKEDDIRPGGLLKTYLELSTVDAKKYFKNALRYKTPCTACGSGNARHEFEKWTFDYVICNECGTLYQSPRPSEETFLRFYRESPSAAFWANTFFPAVAEARRKLLFRPKVQQITSLCQNASFHPKMIADVGAGHGLFLEEWRKQHPQTKSIAIEPHPVMANVCRSKNLDVLEYFIEENNHLHGQIDLVVSLEVIEHVHDPLSFCKSLKSLLCKGGKILLTGLTVDGFDIQVLWKHSQSITPPHHINFISVNGFKQLMKRCGFKDIRVFTPGKLDVNIVENALKEKGDALGNQRFVKTMINRGPKTLKEFQIFLSDHQLSSHCWVWATN